MKRTWIFTGLVVIVAAAGLVVAYLAASKERAGEAERDKPVASESQIKLNANGQATVRLAPDTQKRLALKTVPLAPFPFH
jgi:hypothetical protein